MSILTSYLKFLKNSKNHHGIHSPFVYNLVTKCFYNKKEYPEYQILKNYRKSLLQDQTIINVTDFGAGSRVFKSNRRKISAIAKNAGISEKRAKLLLRIVKYFQPNTILEIGTSLGLATSALSIGNPKAKIVTLEGCKETIGFAQSQISNFKLNNIEFINAKFEDYLKNQQPATSNQQLIYFDGNHSKKATLNYFELLLPTATNNSVWIFDDIYWSQEMQEAWHEIKNHPKVTVTIDTFQWGIVFFRKEQEKEHFLIRV